MVCGGNGLRVTGAARSGDIGHMHSEDGTGAAERRALLHRKQLVYWVGFLEGILASRRIEHGEELALHAEAASFARFFDDPEAAALTADLRDRFFPTEAELIAHLGILIEDTRSRLLDAAGYDETDEINEFLGFCAGVICDGKLLPSEAKAIHGRFLRSPVLAGHPLFAPVRRALQAALFDHVLDPDEARDVQQWIVRLVGDGYIAGGAPSIGAVAKVADPITHPVELTIGGAVFALTGPMRMGPPRFIGAELARLGGRLTGTVDADTDYLVVATSASRHWRTTHFGSQIERARALIDAGHKLQMVSETALERAILLAEATADRPDAEA